MNGEVTVAVVEGYDGGAKVELFHYRMCELIGAEQFLDGFLGVFRMPEVLFFQRWDLLFHVMFQEYRHILAVDRPGHDVIGCAVVIEILDP